MKTPLLFLLFAFILTGLTAQENWNSGEITLTNGQTFSGEINDKEWKKGPFFVEFRTGRNVTTYEPSQVISFVVNDFRYFSAKFDVELDNTATNFLKDGGNQPKLRTDETFIQQIVDGEKKLYRYTDQKNKTHFLIGEPDELQVLMNYSYLDQARGKVFRDVKYRRLLADYLPGCPKLNFALGQLAYKEKDIIDVFKQWYVCADSAITYEEPKRKFGFGFAPVVGYGSSFAEWSNQSAVVRSLDQSPSYDTYLGGVFQLIMPGRNKRFRLNLELLHTSFGFEITELLSESDQVKTFNINRIEDEGIQLYFGPQFETYLGKQPLLFGLGLSRGFYLNHSVEIENFRETTLFGTTSRIIYSDDSRSANAETGIYADVSTRFNRMQLSLRYQYSFGFYDTEDFNIDLNRVVLLAKYALF